MNSLDPVFIDEDGFWWFWDEVWCDKMGPYMDEATTRECLDDYVTYLLGLPLSG